MIDPMEEFEFRPITEGLGFHQKNSEKKQASAQSNPLPPIENLGLRHDIYESKTPTKSSAPTAAISKSIFSEPLLPRTEPVTTNTQTSTPVEVPKFRGPKLSSPAEALKPTAIDTKKEINIAAILEKAQIKAPQKIMEETRIEKECVPSFLSIFLDFTVIAGLSILFLLALSIATQMDLAMIFRGIGTDTGAIAALALLIYSVAQFYMILSRSFFGQTLGEWSMDSHIGTSEQQTKLSYVFRLVLRTWILAVTGMIVLPIISAFTQKDVAGSLCGLKLYRK